MKILVVSDTHGKMENFREAVERENPDRIYHLGDGEGIEDLAWMTTSAPMEIVAGNCDWGSNLPNYVVLEVGKHVLFLAHGHMYNVRAGVDTICAEASKRGCDVVLYGHTHIPVIDYVATENGPMTVANPGSLCFPRQSSRQHTYMIIDVDKEGEMKFSLHSLEQN